MALSFRRWRPRHLLLAWSGYWLALLLVALGRPALAVWRMRRGPEGHGSVAAGFEDAIGSLTVVDDGVTVWSGSASLSTILLWLVGPPLLLWVVWMLTHRRGEAGAAVAAPVAQALRAPMPAGLDGLRDGRTAAPVERGRAD